MQLPRVTSFVLVLGAAMLAGCAEKETPPPGPSQELLSAQDRIQDLERQLNEAAASGARDRERLAALQNELNQLRRQLAERPESEPAPGWDTVPGGAMTSIEGTILFDSGKATLKATARQTLSAVVSVINEKFPDYDVYIFGHTDDEPIRKSGWKDNYELSAQRALSVVRMLRSIGVESKMAAAGWGEQLPIEPNTSPTARQRNRRVEIYAMAPEAGRAAAASPPTGAGRGAEPALEREISPSRSTNRSAATARPRRAP